MPFVGPQTRALTNPIHIAVLDLDLIKSSDIAMSYNVPRVCDIGLLHSYSLRCLKPSVLRRIVPPDSDSAMDGAVLNFTRNASNAQNKN